MMTRNFKETRTDAELVDICNIGQANDSVSAFESLYKRHREFVLRVAMRYANDGNIALDVLQETFTYLLKRFPPVGSGLTLTAKLTTYLYPVAKNFTITALRHAKRSGGSPNALVDELTDPAASQDYDEFDRLLDGLPDERREVLVLRFVEDMSLQDIATALKIPLGTVKSRIHLAIRTLRDSPELKKIFEP